MAEPQDLPTSDTSAPSETTSVTPGKRRRQLLIIVLIFLVLGIAGGIWACRSMGFEETDDATITGHVHPVSARVGGTIQKVFVEDNQYVKAGQLLAVIESTDYEIALSQAEHNLAVAKGQADTAKSSIPVAQAQARSQTTQAQGGVGVSQSGVGESGAAVNEARAGVNTAQQEVSQQNANYQQALADYNRYSNVDPEAVSAQQLDTARTNLTAAEARVNAAKANLAQAQARLSQAQAAVGSSMSRVAQARGSLQGAEAQRLQVNVTQNQYDTAQAQVAVREDEVKQAKRNLAYTRIVAPVAGRVGKKTVEVGQRIQANQPLLSVVGSDLWVTANFKETQLAKMRPGQPVEIHVDAFPDHDFRGRVLSFSPATGAQFALLPPENATGNFTKVVQRVPVKIVFLPETVRGYENLLSPGLSVVVTVDVSGKPRRGKETP